MGGLPMLLGLDIGPLLVVMLVCSVVELFAGLVHLRINRKPADHQELLDQAASLKAEIRNTQFPEMFVVNSKLQRELLKVEKSMDKRAEVAKETSTRLLKHLKRIKLVAYALLVGVFWGRCTVSFSPDFVWPFPFNMMMSKLSSCSRGGVSAMGVVALFQFGIANRYR